jgi:methionyl-tRNA formyltransferase
VNGDDAIGVTAIRADGEADHGPILGQERIPVTYPLRIADAITLLLPAYRRLTADVLARVAQGASLAGTPQDEAAATYSLWRDDDDYAIDWAWDAARIVRFIDAVGPPYRGASTTCAGAPLRVLAAQEIPDRVIENRCPGKLFACDATGPVVVCGRGLVRLTRCVDERGSCWSWQPRRLRLRLGR